MLKAEEVGEGEQPDLSSGQVAGWVLVVGLTRRAEGLRVLMET